MIWKAAAASWFVKMLFALLIYLSVTGCFAQVSWPPDTSWAAIRAQHESRQMHDTVYLLRAQALAERSFKNPELKEKLSKYKAVAWRNRAYQKFRVRYYAFLANHSSLVHQDGYAIYYLQKMEEELKKIRPYTNSLNQPRQLLAIYGDKGNYEKRVAIIDSVTPYLKKLPDLVADGSANINTCINAFTIMKVAAVLYANNKDARKIVGFRNTARAIWLQLKRRPGLDKGKLAQCQLSLLLVETEAAKVLGNDQMQANYLNTAYGLIVSNDTTIVPLFKQGFYGTVLSRLIDYYLAKKQLDSAGYFLSRYQATAARPEQARTLDGTKILRYNAKFAAANADFKAAYQNMLKAYTVNDSIIAIRTSDIHNNMYTHLVAEQRREALLAEQAKIARRNLLIFGIVTILVFTIATFLWLLKINREKANRQIEKLNKSTQIQIAELETHASEIQKKFGMELHDDVAGRLVHLVNHIESQVMTETDPQMRAKLLTITEMVRDAYASTRSKSHEWYFRGSDADKTLFSDRVRQIVGAALTDGTYKKQIEIDDECLEGMPAPTRIQLLKIIQEAVANILKHAKADSVKLFIYEDEGAAVLQIADNGRGFDTGSSNSRKGLGLTSLRNRVREVNGSMEIFSSEKGTELLFSIPV